MDTSRLKKFAQYARRSLIEQVDSKLKLVLTAESEARREHPKAVAKLEEKLESKGAKQLAEEVAYIWFNRFCALRFMDVNQYNRIMVISPLSGQFQPEILAEAKAGHIDEGIVNEVTREKVFGLLSGSITSRDGQSEAFRLLIVAVCNDLHDIMPYLFERISDYTELLMPDDLLSDNSILAYTREAMTPEACESVESIGWLYQFYISEKKAEVFEGLKKNKKITPENIPAATQLFTPDWIVRYLVENSLGRLWMLNNPNSKVIEQMDYYIKPAEIEDDFLQISSPEEIKICDPACGSGHMLTYSYDLLYAIYLDAGYDTTEIPEKILTNNLYGIEIDERAAELAAFALTMKAVKGNPLDDSNNRRRFFRNPVEPNICRLENVSFTDEELDSYIDFVGKDLFTQDLRATLKEFEEADNFGSLIQPTLKAPADGLAALEAKDVSGQLFLVETHKSVLTVLKQTGYLSQKYHVVVANPPYMGSRGMNSRLSYWVKDKYEDSKSDLFAMFIERGLNYVRSQGMLGMITMQSWMFLSSYESLRKKLLRKSNITSMVHLGSRAFDSIGGEVVSTTSFTIEKSYKVSAEGHFFRLVDAKSEKEKEAIYLAALAKQERKRHFVASSLVFGKIPGMQLAYWVPASIINTFSNFSGMGDYSHAFQGIITGNNEYFLRYWHEISRKGIDSSCGNFESAKGKKTWMPYNKGGSFRRWYGNCDHVLRWNGFGDDLTRGRIDNREYFFREGITWSDIAMSKASYRYHPKGILFDAKGPTATLSGVSLQLALGLMNTTFSQELISLLNPTVSFQIEDFYKIPVAVSKIDGGMIEELVDRCLKISRSDWDSFETSVDFLCSPLLHPKEKCIKGIYESLRKKWRESSLDLKFLEEENNAYFSAAYSVGNVVSNLVDEKDVTLLSNPKYRFGSGRSNENLESLLTDETMREFCSYSVGCILGRYSLDKEGLILANQGDTLEEYLKQVPQPSFMPDGDNVIPLIDFDGDWFEDDITERFKQFLKVTFGEEHFSENLAFIEDAIGKDIKKFFLKDFYADHVKRYKKRPIYWLFSSPKGSFNALIYMHRYRPDTVSVVLNDYLREFRTKLTARKESYEQVEISASAGQKEKTQAIKAIQKINKVLAEVNDYEHDILYPLAADNIEIDLDDGVKHNYPLFGKALKKIAGLS